MSFRQGESTLTDAGKLTEARKYLASLKDSLQQMTNTEMEFVTRLINNCQRFGDRCIVSNRELSWLRDINAKY